MNLKSNWYERFEIRLKKLKDVSVNCKTSYFRGLKLNNLTSAIHYFLGVSSNYSSFFLRSCWLLIMNNHLRVLFYSLFH